MKSKILIAVVITVFSAMGCKFWESSPPNFASDPVIEITVIWDRLISTNASEMSTWATTNGTQINDLTKDLNTKSWRILSTIVASHSTRILLVTRNHRKWEAHHFEFDGANLSLFDIDDIGRSGVIDSGSFLTSLEKIMESNLKTEIDLHTDFNSTLMIEKHLTQQIPEATIQQIKRFKKQVK